MLASREELAWSAGLFEGEGCFSGRYAQASSNRGCPSESTRYWQSNVAVTMTDEPTLLKLRDVLGVGKVTARKLVEGRKPAFTWKVQKFEHVQAVVALLWPWLSNRRKARATEILQNHHISVYDGVYRSAC